MLQKWSIEDANVYKQALQMVPVSSLTTEGLVTYLNCLAAFPRQYQEQISIVGVELEDRLDKPLDWDQVWL
jgi:hypothetical protein